MPSFPCIEASKLRLIQIDNKLTFKRCLLFVKGVKLSWHHNTRYLQAFPKKDGIWDLGIQDSTLDNSSIGNPHLGILIFCFFQPLANRSLAARTPTHAYITSVTVELK